MDGGGAPMSFRKHALLFLSLTFITPFVLSCGFIDIGDTSNSGDNGNLNSENENGNNGGGGGGTPTPVCSPKLVLNGSSKISSPGCIGGYVLSLIGTNCSATPLTSAVHVQIQSNNSKYLVSSNNDCSDAKEKISPTIAAGSSSATFAIQGTIAGPNSFVITASDPEKTYQSALLELQASSTTPETIPQSISISGESSVTAGSCLNFTVSFLNSLGVAIGFADEHDISLGGAGNGAFHEGADCNGDGIDKLKIPANTPSITLSYDNTKNETVTLSFDIQGLNKTKTLEVKSDVMNKVAVGGAQSIKAGECSSYSVKVLDSFGNPTTVSSASGIDIGLSGIPTFSSKSCDTALTSFTIPQGNSSGIFYIKTNEAGAYSLNVTATELQASEPFDIEVVPSGATQISFDTLGNSSPILAGGCFLAKVNLKDAYGNPNPASGNLTITLGKELTGGGTDNGKWVTTTTNEGVVTCSDTAITSISIGTGLSESSVIGFKDTKAEQVTLSANHTEFSGASFKLTITAAEAINLVLTPIGYPKKAGECGEIRIQPVDAYNNPASYSNTAQALTFKTTSKGTFHREPTCSNFPVNDLSALRDPVSSFRSSPVSRIYYLDTTIGTHTLTASGNGLNPGTADVTINANVTSRLVLNTDRPTSIEAGKCVGNFKVKVADKYGNPTVNSTGANINIALSGTITDQRNIYSWQGQFYRNGNCNSNEVIREVSIADGASTSEEFFVKDLRTETVDLNLKSESFSGTGKLTILSSTAQQIVLSGKSSIVAGDCAEFQLSLKDLYGNAVSPQTTQMVDLELTPVNYTGIFELGSFYTDNVCTIATTKGKIAPTPEESKVYYRSTKAPLNLVATPRLNGYFSQSFPFLVISATAHHLGFSIPTEIISTAGACSKPITIRVYDKYGNRKAVTDVLPLSLTTTAINAGFYSDSACKFATGSISIADDSDSATFYTLGTKTGTTTITISATGLEQAKNAITQNGGTATQLVLALSKTSPATVGTCVSAKMYVIDSFGNLVVPVGNTITFSVTGSANAYASDNCSGTAAKTQNITVSSQFVAYGSFKNDTNNKFDVSAKNGTLSQTISYSTSLTCNAGEQKIESANCYAYIYQKRCDAYGNATWVLVSYYRNCGCFAPESKITLEGGISERADRIVAGHAIWNPILKRSFLVDKVISGPEEERLLEIGYSDRKVQVSSKHVFFTKNGLKQARALTRKDSILGSDGIYHRIDTLKQVTYKSNQTVYNFILKTDSIRDANSPEAHVIQSDGIVTGDFSLQTLLDKGYLP